MGDFTVVQSRAKCVRHGVGQVLLLLLRLSGPLASEGKAFWFTAGRI